MEWESFRSESFHGQSIAHRLQERCACPAYDEWHSVAHRLHDVSFTVKDTTTREKERASFVMKRSYSSDRQSLISKSSRPTPFMEQHHSFLGQVHNDNDNNNNNNKRESGLIDFLINDSNGHHSSGLSQGTKATRTITQKQESDDMMGQKKHVIQHPIMALTRCCISSQQTPAFVFFGPLSRMSRGCGWTAKVGPQCHYINHHCWRGKTVSCRLGRWSVLLAHVVH